jgi:hypothetical protein
MKKLCFVSFFLFFICFVVFCETEEQEEIDYLLFLPNSSSQFINEEQAGIQLDNLAKYFLDRNIAPGQINIHGYAAVVANDIEPVTLSRDRSIFVINELQKRGVPQNLFSAPVAYGEVDLWGSNIDEENRSPNRRVRIVLNGNILTVQPSTGQVIESEVPHPAAPEIADSEIRISSIDNKAISSKGTTAESEFKFPWWVLFPLLLVCFLSFFLNTKESHLKNQQRQRESMNRR